MARTMRGVALAGLMIVGVVLPVTRTTSTTASDAVAMVSTPARATIARDVRVGPEDLLVQALSTFRAGNVDGALGIVDSLLVDQPNYRLAHLLRGDILAVRAGQPVSVDQPPRSASAVNNLLAEARQRWQGSAFVAGDRLPAPLLKAGPNHPTIVFVDLALSRLFLFDNRGERPELIADYYVSSGKNGVGKRRKGDKKTPLGVYFVTQRLPGAGLPDRYGPVAFPVDYPNDWDARHGRTGSGIWVHGVSSDTYSRPPLDSDGCVALTNTELSQIAPKIEPGTTPVLIGYDEPWLSPNEATALTGGVEEQVEAWRSAWESGNTERYLDYYASDFSGRGMGKKAWSDYKRRVSQNKTFLEVELTDVSVYGYPDEEGVVVVSFEQRYRSNNFNSTSRKRQYWRRDDNGVWRIVSENAATAG
ncbi:MAG: L,D-transpeptidase family protein [Gammaproteobacteria bacterium]